MTWSDWYQLVIAVFLNSRGFAFVLFKGSLAPRDWSIVEVRGDKRERIESRVSSMFARYRPHVVVLQDMSQDARQRPERIRHLNDAIKKLAERHELRTAFVSRSEVRARFAYYFIQYERTPRGVHHAVPRRVRGEWNR